MILPIGTHHTAVAGLGEVSPVLLSVQVLARIRKSSSFWQGKLWFQRRFGKESCESALRSSNPCRFWQGSLNQRHCGKDLKKQGSAESARIRESSLRHRQTDATVKRSVMQQHTHES